MEEKLNVEYAGFWIRFAALILDSIFILAITWPLLIYIYGWEYFDSPTFVMGIADILISWILPFVVVIMFWKIKQSTPGKMLFSLRVVDERTGATLSTSQCVLRYFGYFLSMLPLFMGYFWVGFDKRKQGWHDKIGKSVVIRIKN